MSMAKMAAVLSMQAIKRDKIPDAVWDMIPGFREKDPKESSRERQKRKDEKRRQTRARSEPGDDRSTRRSSDDADTSERRRGRRRIRADDDTAPDQPSSTAPQLSADRAAHFASSRYPSPPPHPPHTNQAHYSSSLPGYHDGPPPESLSSQSPRPRSNTSAQGYTTAPHSLPQMASPPPTHYGSGQESSYYPPRDDYSSRQGYNPARYQPSEYSQGPRSETLALQGPRSTYSDAQYDRRPGSDYDNRYDDRYDDRDEEEDRHRSHSRRSKSHSRRDRSRESEYGSDMHKAVSGIGDKFDISAQGAGAAALGAIAGGFIGHKFGKNSPLATGAGAIIGGLGANAWENRNKHKHDKSRNKDRELVAYEGRSRSSDPRSIEYPDRDDSRRPSSRYGAYDDEYDDDYDDDRSRRRDSRRRRRSHAGTRVPDDGSEYR